MPVGIAANFLIFAQVRLLEVGAAAHQQKLEGVTPVLAVELGGAAQALAKIVQLFGLWRIQIPPRSKTIAEKVVAQLPGLSTKIAAQVVIVQRGAAIDDVTVPIHRSSRARGYVQDSTEAVAVLRRHVSVQQGDCLVDLPAHSGTALRM